MKNTTEINGSFNQNFVENIINEIPFGILILDTNNKVLNWNKKFTQFFDSSNISGKEFPLDKYFYEEFDDSDLIENVKDNPFVYTSKNNKELFTIQRKIIYDDKNNVSGSFIIFYNLKEYQLGKDKYQRIENLDYLTNLPNRRGLYEYYDTLNANEDMHFLFLDIDNFKIVNDVYGHSTGDELLIMVSSKIADNANGTYISRIGGDEFVLVLPGIMTEKEVTDLARKILKEVSNAKYRQDILSTISISIGIILGQKPDCKLDEVLYKCDSAMYRAKKNGKNQFIIFNSMEEEVLERKTIEEEMHLALVNGEFVIYLQPKMNMLTSKLIGAEALVRWTHPKDGVRFPDKFIPIFENTGFIVELDLYVFEEVCKLKKKWNSDIYENMVISVNMSRLHFFRDDFVDKLVSITKKYDVRPTELEIEITENIFLKNGKEILKTVNKLKQAGFFISVDDFGSGFSSLNMLKDIPADILKIDRGFLQISENDEKSKTVIKNVITMGKDLKLQLIAEGVETMDQILFLTSCGCELAQGYYYSKPLPIDAFERYAREHMALNEREVRFSFQGNLKDDNGEYEGECSGYNLNYTKGVIDGTNAIYLPGGDVYKNVIKLPKSIICSESYTVSLWVKAEKENPWTSLFFAEFDNGFASLVPVAWEGASAYRIKDNRDVGGWHDTSCCSLVLNEWIYITVTYDSKSEIARYYSNGRQAGYLEHIPPLRVAKQIILGGDIFQKSFQGYLCDLTIYDRAKSAQDIWSTYRSYVTHSSFKPLWESVHEIADEYEI
jgi:diguanylate cyclase (GGDEF)-like protein